MTDGAGRGDHPRPRAPSVDRCLSESEHAAAGFPANCANRLVKLARFEPGERILDVVTDTGDTTIRVAQMAGPASEVVHGGPAGLLDNDFDAVICNLGILFLPDMLAGLQAWWRVTKPFGRVLFSSLGVSALEPLSRLYDERLRRYGVTLSFQGRPLPKQRLSDPEQCRDLLLAAGFDHVEVRSEQLGYYVPNASQWWKIVGDCGLFGTVGAQLRVDELQHFRNDHLAEVEGLAAARGIWIDGATIFASGWKGKLGRY
jgi:SAM-dependent methyltransferase